MPLRIALCGSAGTGKTTLARRLSAELGVPCIGEGMREYLERTGTDLHALGHDGLLDLVRRLWEERMEAEAANPSFVADRSSYDFAAFWMFYHFTNHSAHSERFFAETLGPGRYSHLFVLPWGAIPLQADGVRSTDRWVQLHVQLLIEGLLTRHADVPPRSLTALSEADRLSEVLAALGLDPGPC